MVVFSLALPLSVSHTLLLSLSLSSRPEPAAVVQSSTAAAGAMGVAFSMRVCKDKTANARNARTSARRATRGHGSEGGDREGGWGEAEGARRGETARWRGSGATSAVLPNKRALAFSVLARPLLLCVRAVSERAHTHAAHAARRRLRAMLAAAARRSAAAAALLPPPALRQQAREFRLRDVRETSREREEALWSRSSKHPTPPPLFSPALCLHPGSQSRPARRPAARPL